MRAGVSKSLPEFDSNITFKEVLDVKREEDVPRALKAWLDKNDLMRKGSDGWTPLHEACNAHNVRAREEGLLWQLRLAMIDSIGD